MAKTEKKPATAPKEKTADSNPPVRKYSNGGKLEKKQTETKDTGPKQK